MENILTFQFEKEKEKYCQLYIEVINLLVPVRATQREIEVLSCIASHGVKLNKDSRKLLMKDLNLSESNLSLIVKSLYEKGFISKKGKEYGLKNFVIPPSNNVQFIIKVQQCEEVTTL
jgi:DNA-binding MarR family transcriptional regulator